MQWVAFSIKNFHLLKLTILSVMSCSRVVWHADCFVITTYLNIYIFAIMKTLEGLAALKNITGQNENVWLLLFKKGAEQSDCAFNNFAKTAAGEGNLLCVADLKFLTGLFNKFSAFPEFRCLYF